MSSCTFWVKKALRTWKQHKGSSQNTAFKTNLLLFETWVCALVTKSNQLWRITTSRRERGWSSLPNDYPSLAKNSTKENQSRKAFKSASSSLVLQPETAELPFLCSSAKNSPKNKKFDTLESYSSIRSWCHKHQKPKGTALLAGERNDWPAQQAEVQNSACMCSAVPSQNLMWVTQAAIWLQHALSPYLVKKERNII